MKHSLYCFFIGGVNYMYHTFAYDTDSISMSGIALKSAGYTIIDNVNEPYSKIIDYNLLYVEKDFENFKLNGEIHSAKAGSIILLEPGFSHIEFLESNHFPEFYHVHFESDETSFFSKMNLKPSVIYPLPPSSTAKNIFETIITEMQQKLPNYEINLKNYFEILLVEFDRKLSIVSKIQFSKEIAPAYTKILENFWENYTLDDYAKMCNLSKFHFSRLFKNYTGFSPIEYRNNIRIRSAKGFLSYPRYSINQVAELCGFANANYFCKAFIKAEGMSPSAYRKIKGYVKK